MKVAAFRAFFHQQGQLLEGEPGAVGMNRRDRSRMADVYLLPIVDESDLVQRTGISVSTPVGRFAGCIQIRESSVLSPDIETKWYAPGIGVVQVKEHSELSSLESIVDP